MTRCEECDCELDECDVIDIGILLVCEKCAEVIAEEECGLSGRDLLQVSQQATETITEQTLP